MKNTPCSKVSKTSFQVTTSVPLPWTNRKSLCIKHLGDQYMGLIICLKEDQLTIPPSWTSWSSATIRMMLLGLTLGSAHLTQQVRSAESSARSVRAAECPLCRLPVAPDPLTRPSIRASTTQGLLQHSFTHTHRCSAEAHFRFLRKWIVWVSVCTVDGPRGIWGSGVAHWWSYDQTAWEEWRLRTRCTIWIYRTSMTLWSKWFPNVPVLRNEYWVHGNSNIH